MEIGIATAAIQSLAYQTVARVPYVGLGIVVFLLFYFAGSIARTLLLSFAHRTRRRHNLGLVLGRLAHAGLVFLGLLVALMIALPGFTPGQLVSVLGISSVAFGFAFRDILQNFLAGILLLLAEPFRIGDQIRTGEFDGTVEDIQTRATFMRTYDGRRIVIPNSMLFVNAVTVHTAFQQRRLEHDFVFKPGADVARLRRLLLSALDGIDDVMRDPAPDAVVVDLTDTVLKIRLRWWVSPPSNYELRDGFDKVLARADALLAQERDRASREAAERKAKEEAKVGERASDATRAQRDQREDTPRGSGSAEAP
jgi:small conductance mechanosensitive channel